MDPGSQIFFTKPSPLYISMPVSVCVIVCLCHTPHLTPLNVTFIFTNFLFMSHVFSNLIVLLTLVTNLPFMYHCLMIFH